jgi:hypothetical protein
VIGRVKAIHIGVAAETLVYWRGRYGGFKCPRSLRKR